MVDLGFPLFPLLTKKSGSYIIYIIVILTTRTYVYGTCYRIRYTTYYMIHLHVMYVCGTHMYTLIKPNLINPLILITAVLRIYLLYLGRSYTTTVRTTSYSIQYCFQYSFLYILRDSTTNCVCTHTYIHT